MYAALQGIHPSERVRLRHVSLLFLHCVRCVTYSVHTC